MPSEINAAFKAHLQHQIRTTHVYLFNKSLLVQELIVYVIAFKLLCTYLNTIEIVECDMPPTFWWEYVWCLSVILPAIFKNRYRIIVILFGIAPLIYGFLPYLADAIKHMTSEDGTIGILMWKGIPLVVLMNPIIIVIIMLQGVSLYFSWNLYH